MNWDKIDTKKAILIQNSIANKGLRFIGAVIDRIVGYAIPLSIGFFGEIICPGSMDVFVNNAFIDKLFTLFTILMYYLVFEYFFQKTIGKLVLGLKVVNEHDGSKPDFKTIVKRTLSRIIGLEAIFYLFGNRLWHDSWSDTVVISEKKYADQNEINEIGEIGLI
jgi:uncharacterized RDD family membrane protein YckC